MSIVGKFPTSYYSHLFQSYFITCPNDYNIKLNNHASQKGTKSLHISIKLKVWLEIPKAMTFVGVGGRICVCA